MAAMLRTVLLPLCASAALLAAASAFAQLAPSGAVTPLFFGNEYPTPRAQTLDLDGRRLGRCFARELEQRGTYSLAIERKKDPGFPE